jgi:UPF0176 protein
MEKLKILQFYKYVPVDSPEKFRKEYLPFLKELGILGRIYIGKEGINASLSGTVKQLDQFKEKLTADKRFSDIRFKYEECFEHPFRKTQVKIKEEICKFGAKVDMSKKGEYVTPKTLDEWYDKKEDFVIVDARNTYESKIGKFKGAITPEIEKFNEFARVVPKVLEPHKEKKIVLYCTGGIRCEKATAYLKQNGFDSVYHVKDGIIKYIEESPNKNWEGANFVFDERMSASQGNKPITNCETCGALSDLYINCNYCNKKTIQCRKCQEKTHKNCCEECEKNWRKYGVPKSKVAVMSKV